MPRELLGFTIHRDERVYGPAEDSMLLASNIEAPSGARCLDLCTGTGLAALRMAREGARTIATDVNPVACRLARRNARENELTIEAICTDLADGLDARFDRIACNPPYLPAGGELGGGPIDRALESGERGDRLTQRLLGVLPSLMREGAVAWVVVSSLQPIEDLQDQARASGLSWSLVEDLPVGRFERLQLVELRART